MRRLTAVLAAGALLAACGGEKGATGTTGSPGTTGAQGPDGPKGQAGELITTGTVSGLVTYTVSTGTFPAANIKVTLTPDVGVSAKTGPDGKFTITAPIGVYSLAFADESTPPECLGSKLDGVAVAAAPGYVTKGLTRINPLVVTPADPSMAVPGNGPMMFPAGFGKPAALAVAVNGQTSDALTYSWKQVAGPTELEPTVDPTDNSKASVTMPKFAAVSVGEDVIGVQVPGRLGLVPVTTEQAIAMIYQYEVTVSDGTFTSKTVVAAAPSMVTQALPRVGVGSMVIANDVVAPDATHAWSLAGPGTPALNDLDTKNPWFIASAAGTYTLTAPSGKALTVSAGSWTGVGSGDPAQYGTACATCHATAAAEWASSRHQNRNWLDATKPSHTLFQEYVNTGHYQEGCATCHTVGYNRGATGNGGFTDVAASLTPPWTIPTTAAPSGTDYFASMDPKLQKLVGVQCENCHGPDDGHAAASAPGAAVNAPSTSHAAGVCISCHDEKPFHQQLTHWAQSLHANPELAIADATVEGRGATAAHCGRCHASQGFVRYAQQQQGLIAGIVGGAKQSGSLLKDDGTAADVAWLTGLGLTQASAEPQTCTTCHDPHTTKLRIPSDTGLLAAGFSFGGAGKGALCMVCHNTRNGARGGAVALTASNAFTAPHAAGQTDVFAGQNVWFLNNGQYLSKHAAVKDTCVGCHMAMAPASLLPIVNDNHTFKADTTICKNCHAAGVDGESLQAQMGAALASLDQTLAAQITKRLNALADWNAIVWDPVSDAYTATAVTVKDATHPNTVTGVSFFEIHGQFGLVVTVSAALPDYTIGAATFTGVKTFYVQMGSAKSGGTGATNAVFSVTSADPNYLAANVTLVKALWNRFLVAGKSENGVAEGLLANAIHNPSFVLAAINAAAQQSAALY